MNKHMIDIENMNPVLKRVLHRFFTDQFKRPNVGKKTWDATLLPRLILQTWSGTRNGNGTVTNNT